MFGKFLLINFHNNQRKVLPFLLLFITLSLISHFLNRHAISIGVVLLLYGFLAFWSKGINANFHDINFKYRVREIFLLPLSRLEIFILMTLEILVTVLWVTILVFNTFRVLNPKFFEPGFISINWVFSLLSIFCFFSWFRMPFAYKFEKISASKMAIITSKSVFYFFLGCLTLAVLVNYFHKRYGLSFEHSSIVVVFMLCTLIWINIFSNFQNSYFNEHAAFKKLVFNPVTDCSAFIALMFIISQYRFS